MWMNAYTEQDIRSKFVRSALERVRSTAVKTSIKWKLLEECNLHTIVRLPPGVFNPYSAVNTNLIFFEKGMQTEEVWYYQIPLPGDLNNQYTKTRGIRHEEFDGVRAWWHNRTETEHAWRVPIEQIREHGYNLDFKNPHQTETESYREPREIVESIEEKERAILAEVEKVKETI